jgi:hypothetical protein
MICHDFTGQSVKHPRGILLTEGGIRIDRNAVQLMNASFSIERNRDPDSKENDESLEHLEKQPSQRTSTEAGMEIDRKPEQ